jgi:hypothetical protein
MTISRHGKITAEEARKLAIATLGETVKGRDPAEERIQKRKALTVKELCDRYLAAAEKGLVLGKGDRPKKARPFLFTQNSVNASARASMSAGFRASRGWWISQSGWGSGRACH